MVIVFGCYLFGSSLCQLKWCYQIYVKQFLDIVFCKLVQCVVIMKFDVVDQNVQFVFGDYLCYECIVCCFIGNVEYSGMCVFVNFGNSFGNGICILVIDLNFGV